VKRFFIFIVLISFISLLISCTGNIKFDIKPNKEYKYSETVSASGIDEIRVNSNAGYIKIVGVEGNNIALNATVWSAKELTSDEVNGVISVEKEGGVVTVKVDEDIWKAHGINSIDYMIKVPKSLSVDLITASGDLNLSEMEGSFHLDTESGDIYLLDVGGSGSVNTQNGDVIAKGTSQNISITTSNGDIKVEGISDVTANTSLGDIEATRCGVVDVETLSGDVIINDVPEFKVKSSLGDITIDTVELSGESDARTESGDVKLTMSTFKKVVAEVSSTGDILLSGIEISADEEVRMVEAHTITLRSGGEGVVELFTLNGDISIVRVTE